MRLGGRVAEELVFGHQSTGAENDLVGNTELARKMVREWGMSDRIGPMAWGSQGAVFLGEDLMHSRDYSDETARVIDEEVERILRDEEDRCRKMLDRVPRRASTRSPRRCSNARRSTAQEVADLVDNAMGRKVGGPRMIIHADGTEESGDRADRGSASTTSTARATQPRSSASGGPEVGRGERADERRARRRLRASATTVIGAASIA